MRVKIEWPQAFSVGDERELVSIRHLMARLHPGLLVKQVATGVHVNGGGMRTEEVADSLKSGGDDGRERPSTPSQ